MLKGDGCDYTATVGSTFDAVLAVFFSFTGCEQLYCESQTYGNTLSWTSWSDLDYYILVAGFPGETGGYTLTLTVGPGIAPQCLVCIEIV